MMRGSVFYRFYASLLPSLCGALPGQAPSQPRNKLQGVPTPILQGEIRGMRGAPIWANDARSSAGAAHHLLVDERLAARAIRAASVARLIWAARTSLERPVSIGNHHMSSPEASGDHPLTFARQSGGLRRHCAPNVSNGEKARVRSLEDALEASAYACRRRERAVPRNGNDHLVPEDGAPPSRQGAVFGHRMVIPI